MIKELAKYLDKSLH